MATARELAGCVIGEAYEGAITEDWGDLGIHWADSKYRIPRVWAMRCIKARRARRAVDAALEIAEAAASAAGPNVGAALGFAILGVLVVLIGGFALGLRVRPAAWCVAVAEYLRAQGARPARRPEVLALRAPSSASSRFAPASSSASTADSLAPPDSLPPPDSPPSRPAPPPPPRSRPSPPSPPRSRPPPPVPPPRIAGDFHPRSTTRWRPYPRPAWRPAGPAPRPPMTTFGRIR